MTRLIVTGCSSRFWRDVRRSASGLRDAPPWMKAGIVLNPEHFVTYRAEPVRIIPKARKT